MRDPAVLRLAQKVRYQVAPNDPYPDNYVGALTVRMKDGKELTASQPCMRGGRRARLSDAEITAKFRANTAFGGWDDALADRYLSFCDAAFDDDRIDLTPFRA